MEEFLFVGPWDRRDQPNANLHLELQTYILFQIRCLG